jgi:hypothetical protein
VSSVPAEASAPITDGPVAADLGAAPPGDETARETAEQRGDSAA